MVRKFAARKFAARKFVVASTVAGMLLMITACGSSSPSAGAAGVTSAPASPASSVSGTSGPLQIGSATPSPADTPAPTPALVACTNSVVGVSASTTDGAAGTHVQRFVVTNGTLIPCTMAKYPFVSPYGKHLEGDDVSEVTIAGVKVGPIRSDFGDIGGTGGLRTLGASGTAVFFMKWSDVPVGTKPCAKADGFYFQPPQDLIAGDNKAVPFTFTICGGVVQISQILPPSVRS